MRNPNKPYKHERVNLMTPQAVLDRSPAAALRVGGRQQHALEQIQPGTRPNPRMGKDAPHDEG